MLPNPARPFRLRSPSRHNGDGAPDIIVALGGVVADHNRLGVGADAGTGVDIDAAAQAVAAGVPLAIGVAPRLPRVWTRSIKRREARKPDRHSQVSDQPLRNSG